MALVGLAFALSGCVGSMVCEYVPSVHMTPISFPPPVVHTPILEGPVREGPIVETRPVELAPPSERGTRRAPQSTRGSTPQRAPGSFRLTPVTPDQGSPEATREERQSEQRERELNRQIRGICRGC